MLFSALYTSNLHLNCTHSWMHNQCSLSRSRGVACSFFDLHKKVEQHCLSWSYNVPTGWQVNLPRDCFSSWHNEAVDELHSSWSWDRLPDGTYTSQLVKRGGDDMTDVCWHAHAGIKVLFKISDTDSWDDYTIGQLELAAVNKMQATSSRTPQKFRLG